jgi:hypothetical protein
MGPIVAFFYLTVCYLSAPAVFGQLIDFKISEIISAAALLASVPALTRTFVQRTPQTLAVLGLCICVGVSIVAKGFGLGAIGFTVDFLTCTLSFFYVCLHCTTKKRLYYPVIMLFFVCCFVIAQGLWELKHPPVGMDRLEAYVTDQNQFVHDHMFQTPYWIGYEKKDDSGNDIVLRLRGQGTINDPNDFAQVIVCTIPLMFILWRRRNMLWNLLFVFIPVGVLLAGVFLTHSRGALLAVLAMTVVAARRRIGTIPSLVLAGGLFVGAMALSFTGGRNISVDAGTDRTMLWGEGLEMLKTHPLVGVGYSQMAEGSQKTAHNSIVVCAAELGIFGIYFWSMFLLPTVRDTLAIASPEKTTEGEPIVPEETLPGYSMPTPEFLDKAEINRLGKLVLLSLVGFMVTGMFLSRAFAATLFLVAGIAEAVYQMALKRGIVSPRMPYFRVIAYSGPLAVALVLGIYLSLRVTNLMH